MAIELKVGLDKKYWLKEVERGKKLAQDAMKKSGGGLKLKIDEKGFRQPLGRISGDLKQFDSALAASNARVIAFGASTAVIGGISKAFKELAKTTIEVGKQFSDINRILQLSSKDLEKFGNKLFEIGKKNATAFQDTTKAALEFARQGLATEETLKRTSDALTLVRLTGINADKAVSSLTATVNAFDNAMVTTTSSVNKFVAVETKFAVGARDLVEAIGRVGSSAKDAKVGFDELNAMVTAVQQTTGRGGAVIGNAMKTIFTRLQRQSTLDALEAYGVAVKDVQGATLPAIQILDNFARSYKGLTDNSQAYLREQVAGVFQANILSAILRDLNKGQSTFSQALKVSTNATNEADQATAKLNQTLSALATQTGLEFKRLQQNIGKSTFEPIAKGILEPLKTAMKGINDLIDGEGAGSDVANGFLKGIKNIIGGPGLVAVIGLIGKVFINTTGYLLKSLPALAGITSQTQKRAVLEEIIENALKSEAGLAQQIQSHEGNAAVQAGIFAGFAEDAKQDLEKQEKSVRAIASTLSRMPKATYKNIIAASGGKKGGDPRGAAGFVPGMAGEAHDIRRGVGGVSSSSKPVSIPNFSFGGGVRGTMIANTGEYMVPNFKGGGSAIFNPNMVAQFGMPTGAKPIRGAGGYVPNFVDLNRADAMRELEGMRKYGRGYSEADLTRTRGIAGMFGITGKNLKPGSVKQRIERGGKKKAVKGTFLNATTKAHMLVPQSGFRSENYPYIFGQGSALQKLAKTHTKKDVDGMILSGYGPSLGATKEAQKGGRLAKVEDVLDNALVKAAESVIMAYSPALATTPVSKKKVEGTFLKEGGHGAMGAFKGALFEAIVSRLIGQKYEKGAANTSTLDVLLSGRAGKNAEELFGITQTAATHADVKSSWSSGNRAKIAEQIIKNFKGAIPTTVGASRGYIPNFAALGDSVEREAAAGVPLGSIRVGRSRRLAGPNNPAGLAVTNTRDEPRGLKDVVGAARGYVPNYVIRLPEGLTAKKGKGWAKLVEDKQKLLAKQLEEAIRDYQKGNIGRDQLNSTRKSLSKAMSLSAAAEEKVANVVNRRANAVDRQTRMNASKGPGMMSKVGSQLGGMGGIGLSMGLPMAAGFAEQAGASKVVSGTLSGAGTGAAMGMMFGPWGTAIGAAVGALGGFVSKMNDVGTSLEDLKKSADEYEQETNKNKTAAQEYIQAIKDISSGGTQAELEDAQKRLAKNFDAIKGTELEKKFQEAGTSVNDMTAALAKYTDASTGRLIAKRAAQMGKGFDIGFRDIVKQEQKVFTDDLTSEAREKLAAEGWVSTGFKDLEHKEFRQGKLKRGGQRGPKIGVGQVFEREQFVRTANEETEASFLSMQKEFVKKFGDMFKILAPDAAFFKEMEKAANLGDALGLSDVASGQDNARAALIKLFRERSSIFTDISDDEMNAMFGGDILEIIKGKFKSSGGGRAGGTRRTTQIMLKLSEWWDKFNTTTGGLPPVVVAMTSAANEAAENFTRIKSGLQRMVESLTQMVNALDNVEKVRKAFVGERVGLLKGAGMGLGVGGFERAQSDAAFKAQRQRLTTQTAAGNAVKIATAIRGGGAAVGDTELARLERAEHLFMTNIEGGLDAFATFTAENTAEQEKINKLINNLRITYKQQAENINLDQAITNAKMVLEQKRRENIEKERIMNDEMSRMMHRRRMGAMETDFGRQLNVARIRERELNDPRQFRGTGFRTQAGGIAGRAAIEQRIADIEFQRQEAAAVEDSVQKAQAMLVQQQVIQSNVDLVNSSVELKNKMDELISEYQKQHQLVALGARPMMTDEGAQREGYMNAADYRQAAGSMAITQEQRDFDRKRSAIVGSKFTKGTPAKRYTSEVDFAKQRIAARELAATMEGLKTQQEVITALGKAKTEATGEENKILRDNIDSLLRDIQHGKKRLDNEKAIADEVRNMVKDRNISLDADARSFKTQFKAGMLDIYEETDYIYAKLGKDLPTAFREGMVNALEVSLDKAESFGDAMRGVAVDMLKMIRHASLMHSMSNFTNLLGMGTKGFRTSQHGSIVPGSGTGDKVPTLLEPGEYVMNRKAVQGVGKSNLDQINFGSFPRFGGGQTGGGTMFLNEKYSSDKMSGFFLASDNPELMEARGKAREAYQKEQEKRAEKKSLRNAFLSTLASAGVGKLMNMGASAWKDRGTKKFAEQVGGGEKWKDIQGMYANKQEALWAYSGRGPTGGTGANYRVGDYTGAYGPTPQRGGHIGRGFTNRDSVPAYMAGGEFVMNNRAVRKYGLGYMGRLNGGLIPAMQTGGAVGAEAAPLNAQTAANTNNISINVNVGGGEGGSGQGASSSTGNQNASEQSNEDRATQGKELGEKIRGAVLEVIQTEQRLGGSLSSSARKP